MSLIMNMSHEVNFLSFFSFFKAFRLMESEGEYFT